MRIKGGRSHTSGAIRVRLSKLRGTSGLGMVLSSTFFTFLGLTFSQGPFLYYPVGTIRMGIWLYLTRSLDLLLLVVNYCL